MTNAGKRNQRRKVADETPAFCAAFSCVRAASRKPMAASCLRVKFVGSLGLNPTAGSNPALSALKSVHFQGVFPAGRCDRVAAGEPTLAKFLLFGKKL